MAVKLSDSIGEKSGKILEEAYPFFRLLPAFSETVCGKGLRKIYLFRVGFINSRTFFRFFQKSILGLPDRANPVAIGKLPVTMRSEKQAFCESFEM
jgi:hypothetical protein